RHGHWLRHRNQRAADHEPQLPVPPAVVAPGEPRQPARIRSRRQRPPVPPGCEPRLAANRLDAAPVPVPGLPLAAPAAVVSLRIPWLLIRCRPRAGWIAHLLPPRGPA